MKKARHSFLTAGFAAAVMMSSSTGCFAQDGGTADKAANTRPAIMVLAHRGGAMLRPENTMSAFRHAAELGVEFLEFDMEMTADDQIVIYHDANINPAFCTPDAGSAVVAGPVRKLSFAETQQFDCGSGVRPAYAGEGYVAVPGARIPALDDVLSGFRDSDAAFFAEIKMPKVTPGIPDVDPVKFARLVNAAVLKHGLEDRLILQSFDFRAIDAMHEINPRIRTCLLGAEKLTRDYMTAVRQHHASCIVLNHTNIDAAGVRQLQESGVLVYSNVADKQDDWSKYVSVGMNAIFTNDPAGVIEYLKKSGLRD